MSFKRKILIIIVDIIIVFFSFLFFAWIKPGTRSYYIPYYINSFYIFAGVWLIVSLVIDKFNISKKERLKDLYVPIIIANTTLVAIITTLIYYFHLFNYSRLIVFGTILLSTGLEMLVTYLYYYDKLITREAEITEKIEERIVEEEKELRQKMPFPEPPPIEEYFDLTKIPPHIRDLITSETSGAVFEFISRYIDLSGQNVAIVSTTTSFNIGNLEPGKYRAIVNLKRSNDIRRVNKFFETINARLPAGGKFIGCAETYWQRRERLVKGVPPVISHIFLFFDFIYKRVFPKLFLIKNIYFAITHGRRRVLSLAETLGRLVSCGFDIIHFEEIDHLIYFVVKKVKEPAFDMNPSYGPVFKMKRVGKNGKIIGVYKFRTMHPYAEYLHDYILRTRGYSEIGKPADDFRLTSWGKFLRKYWLDELPQLINVLQGNMKIVGVRPLSLKVFNDEYPEDIKAMRIRHKPGCIPPYVALLMDEMDQSIEAERIYMLEKEKHPLTTDIRYFFKAIYNIVTNKIRSG